MTGRKSKAAVLIILLGICTSFMQINPLQNSVSFGYIILQLSGARGMLSLHYSMAELLEFYFLLIPNNILIILFGKEIYEHFCVASIYIFSRCENRMKWYYRLVFKTILEVCLLELLYLITIIAVSSMRYEMIMDIQGLAILLVHFLLFSLWMIASALFVNILSLRVGSSYSYLVFIMLESCSIALLTLLKFVVNRKLLTEVLLYCNPMANLVLCWHDMKYSFDDFGEPRFHMSMAVSVFIFFLLALFMIIYGGYQVRNKEILIENNEIGTL